MLITVINAIDYESTRNQILAVEEITEGIELRLDYWKELNIDDIQKIRDEFKLPTIFTLRKKNQGGLYTKTEKLRLIDILKLCELEPDYLDLEYSVALAFFKKIHKNFPKIQIICSFHDFKKTPEDLETLLQTIQKPNVAIYKIATHAVTTLDALRMLLFIAKAHLNVNIAGMCMGPFGTITRLIGAVVGSFFTYAAPSTESTSVLGQLTLEELRDTYHLHQLNKDTKIYALLGDPVEQSVGHIFHNEAIRYLKQNAIYIKIPIPEIHLAEALIYLRALPFAGFSVTMPLKEKIVPLLDSIDISAESIQAINTIVVKETEWIGFNTDGIGAIEALKIKTDLNKKKIVILGAGGTARAIAHAAHLLGAEVIILNRTLKKAEQLALLVKGQAYGLDKIQDLKEIKYDAIINTLPCQFEITKDNFIPGTLVMDCVYQPINTPFLIEAEKANCICIPGCEMYIHQAFQQIFHWFQL